MASVADVVHPRSLSTFSYDQTNRADVNHQYHADASGSGSVMDSPWSITEIAKRYLSVEAQVVSLPEPVVIPLDLSTTKCEYG